MAQEGMDKGMITLREQAVAPATVVAGQGSVYVKNETPTILAFVGDDNTEHGILTSGAPILMSGQCNASGSYIGMYQASGNYLDSSQVFLSGVAGMSGDWVGKYVVSGTTAYQQSGQCLVSGDLQPAISGMGLRDGLQVSGNYSAPSSPAYGEIFGGNIGNGIVNNYVAGVASGVVLDTISGRITVAQDGDYFVGFQAQLVATSGGSTTKLSIKKNNTAISGAEQQCISPALVGSYAYREGNTQSCLVPCVSGDYLTAFQDAVDGTWTINYAKLYAFKR